MCVCWSCIPKPLQGCKTSQAMSRWMEQPMVSYVIVRKKSLRRSEDCLTLPTTTLFPAGSPCLNQQLFQWKTNISSSGKPSLTTPCTLPNIPIQKTLQRTTIVPMGRGSMIFYAQHHSEMLVSPTANEFLPIRTETYGLPHKTLLEWRVSSWVGTHSILNTVTEQETDHYFTPLSMIYRVFIEKMIKILHKCLEMKF